MQLTYDIMLGNRHDCIERMEELVDTAAPEARAKLYMLIAKQYRNAGNREKARYYEGLLKQFIAENSMPRPKGAQAEEKPGEPSETADGK